MADCYITRGGGKSGVKMEVLWENASPTSSFAAQSIAVSAEYELYAMEYAFSPTEPHRRRNTLFNFKGFAGILSVNQKPMGGRQAARTFLMRISGDNINFDFSDGYEIPAGSNSFAINNVMLIPCRIFGAKGVEIK